MVEQHLDHRRGHVRDRDPVRLDRAQDRFGVEFAVQVHGAAAPLRAELYVLGTDMEHRHHQQRAVGGAGTHQSVQNLRRPDFARMREHHPLGPSGRAAGVDQAGQIVFARRHRRFELARGQHGFIILGPVAAATDADEMFDRRQIGAQRVDRRRKLGFEHDSLGRAVVNDVRDFGACKAEADRCRRDAAQFACGIDLADFQRVLAEHRDAVLRAQPARFPRRGEPRRAVEIGAMCQRAPRKYQARFVLQMAGIGA